MAIKNSKQRDLILKIVRSSRCHPGADWIYAEARKVLPNISLGTIYRNLNLLVQEGKIQELTLENNTKRYDGDLRHHYHVTCLHCNEIKDVPHMSIRADSDEIENMTGYQIMSHRLEFTGFCPECKKQAH